MKNEYFVVYVLLPLVTQNKLVNMIGYNIRFVFCIIKNYLTLLC